MQCLLTPDDCLDAAVLLTWSISSMADSVSSFSFCTCTAHIAV